MSRKLAAVAVLAIALAGCSNSAGSKAPSDSPKADGITVFATTGYIADAVLNIDPTAQVTTMVGPGGDPHTYQPSTGDMQKMQSAKVVLWNGLHLEAQMLDVLKGLGDKQLAVGETVPKDMLLDWPEKDAQGNALHDPHIWNNPTAWTHVVTAIADKLGKADPANADKYKKNAKAYNEKIEKTITDVKKLLEPIPEQSRVLITGHDAFNYFGKTFNLKVHATDFVSSEAKLSATEISELAELIASAKVPTIFQDNLANPQAITSLKEAVKAKGWDVQISNEELYADSLGTDAPVNTYLGVLEHNAKAIAEALTPKTVK